MVREQFLQIHTDIEPVLSVIDCNEEQQQHQVLGMLDITHECVK